jgi:hypothetical protein
MEIGGDTNEVKLSVISHHINIGAVGFIAPIGL